MTDDGGRPIRVLHVEDDPDFADLAATMLERERADLAVETAADAEAGLAALGDEAFDCVVSDYDMPGMDGLSFLGTVRERYPDLPFVLFTGKGSEEIASEAIAAGVTDYIQKQGGREQYAMLANRIENAVERHRTGEALRKERRRFELIGRASADAFWHWDLRTGAVERSEGYERIFGFDAEEVGEEIDWWVQQVHPDDRETVRRATREAIQSGDDTIEVDYRVETADGTLKDAYTRAQIVRDADGEAVRVVGAVTDVTDLKRRERELERVRERLELVLEGTDTGVWEWDPGTDEMIWDRTVERLFGVDPETFEGTYDAFHRRVHEEDREHAEGAIERAIAGEEQYHVEFRIRRDDGCVRWVRAKGVPPKGEDEGPGRFVGLINDVTEQKDRERELAQYETIVETVPDGVFVVDEEAVILGGNAIASEMLGFSRDELVGTRFEELIEAGVVDPRVVDRYLDSVRQLLSSDNDDEEAGFEIDAWVDGEKRVFESRLALRPFEDEFRGTIGIIRDVTDRKEREQRLRRSERRFEAVFDDPSAFIGLLEPDGSLLLANETALEFVGADLADVAGRHFADTPWWEDETPEKRAEMEAGIERAASGEFVRFEASHSGVDGRTIGVEGHIRPVTDESGAVVSLLVEGIDVTERIEHERRIEGLHETTRELFRADDPDEVASVVVRAAAEVLGFPNTVVRLRDGDLLRPVAVSEEAREKRGERPVYHVDEGFPGRVLAEGEPLVVSEEDDDSGLHPSRLYLPIGKHGTLSIGEDEEEAFDESDVALTEMLTNNAAVVLDRIQGEQKLRERELSLSRQNERLDRFARIVSHDLRNPLNVAKGGVDLIEEDTGSEHVGMVESALDRMDDIIGDALSLARQGQAVVDPDPVDLEAAVGAAWETVAAEEATLDVVDRLGTCRADESRLRQLLENLFQNAVEHGGPDVAVEVGTIADGGAVGVASDGEGNTVAGGAAPVGFYVADDGPGIPASEREDVFEFGWSHADGGTGFGLAIIEEIAEAHGWSAEATESASGGARFEVTGVDGTDAGELDAGFEEA